MNGRTEIKRAEFSEIYQCFDALPWNCLRMHLLKAGLWPGSGSGGSDGDTWRRQVRTPADHRRPQRGGDPGRAGPDHRLCQRGCPGDAWRGIHGRARGNGRCLSRAFRPALPQQSHPQSISDRARRIRRDVPRRDRRGDPDRQAGRDLRPFPPQSRGHGSGGQSELPRPHPEGRLGPVRGRGSLRKDLQRESGPGRDLPALRPAPREGQSRVPRDDGLYPGCRHRPAASTRSMCWRAPATGTWPSRA